MTSGKSPSAFSQETDPRSLSEANCIVLRLDAQGHVIFLNPFGLDFFDYQADDILGRSVVGTIVPEKDYIGNDSAAIIADLLRQPDNSPHQINENRRRNGDRVWIAWSNQSFWDHAGNLTDILCIGNDITNCKTVIQEQNDRLRETNNQLREEIDARKETERQLIQSQKMEAVGTLASGIAHDFNNMLAGIQGNVDIIRHQLGPDSSHNKGLSIISQIVHRGAKLSGQLLGHLRGGKVDIVDIDLKRLVEETIEMFGRAHRQITIQTRLRPDTPNVKGDRTQIEQVLLNLMINAVHAMPSGGRLFLETTATTLSDDGKRAYEIIPGHYAMLSVRDTGYGMDQETQKQIFEPFFTTKAQGQGTGLGLTATYGIVKNHKGYIDVFSEPKVGTQFNLLLPSSKNTDPAVAANKSHMEKGTETILIVDDEMDFLDVGRQMLGLLGYTVITASSGDEAVTLYEKQAGAIDLIILDMIMPDRSAEETIVQLQKIDPDVQVLLASGYSQDGERARKVMGSCRGFIQKPFRLMTLSSKIREILGTEEE